MQQLGTRVGRFTLDVATLLGGMVLMTWRASHSVRRMERDELLRSLRGYGEASLLIVFVTSTFVGMIMVLQAAVYVRRYAVYNLVGAYTGYATLREVGPVLIALMFSGRVGASHCSELATMKINEQLDALRVLAIDVYDVLITPRLIAMVIALLSLVIMGNVTALLAGACAARMLLGIDFHLFFSTMLAGTGLSDLFIGLCKSSAFALVIALISTHFGMQASGGSESVGRAVNAQVVACAAGVFLMDYVVTVLLP